MGYGASLTGSRTRTNAPTINTLEGLGYAYGVSGGEGMVGGIDKVHSVVSKEEIYTGTSISSGLGIGTSVEAHLSVGRTKMIASFNVFETLDRFYNTAENW